MKAAAFEFHRPATLDETLALLRDRGGESRVLAGGQSLVPMLHMRLVQPELVIDLERIDGLAGITLDDDVVRIGAMTRYADLECSTTIAEHVPLIGAAVRRIGDRQVRNRGTIGGSLAQADPVGEMPLVCLTLNAAVVVRSNDDTRTIPIDDFLLGAYTTDLEDDELITAVQFPRDRRRCVLHEVTRRHNDFAVLAVSASAEPRDDGTFHDVRIAIAGLDDRAILADHAMRELEGTTLDVEACAQAAFGCADLGDPASDVRASADYRRHLAAVHVRRVLLRLASGEGTVGV